MGAIATEGHGFDRDEGVFDFYQRVDRSCRSTCKVVQARRSPSLRRAGVTSGARSVTPRGRRSARRTPGPPAAARRRRRRASPRGGARRPRASAGRSRGISAYAAAPGPVERQQRRRQLRIAQQHAAIRVDQQRAHDEALRRDRASLRPPAEAVDHAAEAREEAPVVARRAPARSHALRHARRERAGRRSVGVVASRGRRAMSRASSSAATIARHGRVAVRGSREHARGERAEALPLQLVAQAPAAAPRGGVRRRARSPRRRPSASAGGA